MKIHQREKTSGKLILPSAPGAFSYWMMPGPGVHAEWQPIVTSLATKYGGANFEPHVTVYFSPFHEGLDPEHILKELKPIQIELTVVGLEFSDIFTKTCFIQFASNEQLQILSSQIRHIARGEEFSLNPHMSLFYGHLSQAHREEIAHDIRQILPHKMIFTGIWAVSNLEGVIGINNSSHVEGWQRAAATDWSDY